MEMKGWLRTPDGNGNGNKMNSSDFQDGNGNGNLGEKNSQE